MYDFYLRIHDDKEQTLQRILLHLFIHLLPRLAYRPGPPLAITIVYSYSRYKNKAVARAFPWLIMEMHVFIANAF